MDNGRDLARTLVLVALSLGLFLAYIPVLVRDFGWPGKINSDLVELFLLVQDVLRDPIAVRTWHQTTTLFVVPDWLLAAVVVQAPLSNVWLPSIYQAAHLLLLALAIAAVLRVVTERPFATALAMTLAIGVMFALLARSAPDARIGPAFVIGMGGPYNHAGAGLMTMAASACYLAAIKRSLTRRPIGLVCVTAVIAALATASDPIFLIWFTAPALVALWLAPPTINRGDQWRITALMLGASIAGWLVSALALGVSYGGGTTVLDSAIRAAGMAKRAVESRDLTFAALLAPIVVVAVRAVVTIFRRRARDNPPDVPRFFELLMAGSAACTILGPIASAVVVDAGSIRYFKFLFPIALALTTYGVLRSGIGCCARTVPLGSSALLAALLAVEAWRGLPGMRDMTWSDPLVACLVRENAKAGFGDYWSAKETIFRSDRRIHVVQITPDGQPYRWSFNERWFWRRADNGRALAPHFVVIDRLGARHVRDLFGAPERAVACGGHTVWFYDRTLALPYAAPGPATPK